jgi:hypothetical protein
MYHSTQNSDILANVSQYRQQNIPQSQAQIIVYARVNYCQPVTTPNKYGDLESKSLLRQNGKPSLFPRESQSRWHWEEHVAWQQSNCQNR